MCGCTRVYIKVKFNTVILGDRIMGIFISYFHFIWIFRRNCIIHVLYYKIYNKRMRLFFLMVLQINPIKTTLSVVQKNQLRTMQLCGKLRLMKWQNWDRCKEESRLLVYPLQPAILSRDLLLWDTVSIWSMLITYTLKIISLL